MKQTIIFGIVLWATLSALAQPTITQPPTNQTVALGDTLTLGVTAGGTTPAYQWFKDSRLLVGATNSTLTVANAGVTNSGTYYVVVTNSGGMVITLPALVSVGNPSLMDWGWNYYGQLGIGTTNNSNTPIIVASNVVAGAAGVWHSLFVKSDGTLWAMGYNAYGELGNGTTRSTNLPVNVASNVIAVAAGMKHSLFVETNGTLWAMGDDTYGQLGNGHSGYLQFFPTPVSVASNVVAVAAGASHSLFLKTDGTLWAIGENNYGQLGNGNTNSTKLQTCVASNVVAVAAGFYHSLFVTADGTLWAMGNNNYGQLGNGTTNNIDLPVSVASNVLNTAGGNNHSLFTKIDGTLWAMGINNVGQLGNGTIINTNLPVCAPQICEANVFADGQANYSIAIGSIKATATTTPPGLTVNLTYNGSPNAPTNAGSYAVTGVISDPNYYGIATNTLVVGQSPQSFGVSSTNSQQLTLQLTGTPNYPYILQSATNLTPPINWQPVFTNFADTNGNWSFTITGLTNYPAGFYRAVAQ